MKSKDIVVRSALLMGALLGTASCGTAEDYEAGAFSTDAEESVENNNPLQIQARASGRYGWRWNDTALGGWAGRRCDPRDASHICNTASSRTVEIQPLPDDFVDPDLISFSRGVPDLIRRILTRDMPVDDDGRPRMSVAVVASGGDLSWERLDGGSQAPDTDKLTITEVLRVACIDWEPVDDNVAATYQKCLHHRAAVNVPKLADWIDKRIEARALNVAEQADLRVGAFMHVIGHATLKTMGVGAAHRCGNGDTWTDLCLVDTALKGPETTNPGDNVYDLFSALNWGEGGDDVIYIGL